MSLRPGFGAFESLVPPGVQTLALVLADGWLELAIGGPLRSDFLLGLIEAHGKPGQISCAHGGGFCVSCPNDRHAQEIG